MQIRKVLKSPLITFLFWASIVAGVYYYYSLKGEKFVNKIMEHPKLTTGIITNVTYVAKKGYYLEYNFYIDGGTTSSGAYKGGVESIRNSIVNKSFPVIYNKYESDKNTMLILPEHFKEFNLPYPDSLRWITNHR